MTKPKCPVNACDLLDLIATARAQERQLCIRLVQACEIPSDSPTSPWNAAISVAVEYLRGAYE